MTARSPALVTFSLSFGLILGQLALMAVPALSVDLAVLWQLDATELGWLGGIYFAGYAIALPFLAGAANRTDGRIVYAGSALTNAIACLCVPFLGDGFWGLLVLRFAAGIGFAGLHIIGMKLLADRLSGNAQARASAVYTTAFAIGSGCSFLIAGLLAGSFGWQAPFVAAGFGSLLSISMLSLIGPPLAENTTRSARLFPDFRTALRDPEIRRYVIAYGGNIWEVFATRVWFVPVLTFSAAYNGMSDTTWDPTIIAGLSVFVSVPMNLIIAELGIRFGRQTIILAVSLASIAVCGLLGWQAAGPYLVVLLLLLLHGITSFGDVGAIAGGMVAVATGEKRAAALTLFGLVGFAFGFLGSIAAGLAIDMAGGRGEPTAWLWAFAVMAIGSVISGAAMIWKPRRSPPR